MHVRPTKLSVEPLEQRAMLSADAFPSGVAPLDDAYYVADASATLATNDATIELATLETTTDKYDVVYELKESGRVALLGQNGVQYLSTYVYCETPDSVYVRLWEEAIARWEEVFTVGAEDLYYPYYVDGQAIAIDDVYLYFGFSDSYSTSGTLGSSINGGYCRDDGLGLPATGSLVFNAKYFVANPSEAVQTVFFNTALHELAHALGYNLNHLRALGLVESSYDAPYGLDELFDYNSNWYYVGEHGVEQYVSTYPELASFGNNASFPMETYTASGSFGTHPSSLLATHFFNYNQRDGLNYAISSAYRATITKLTLGVFEDLGYQVDYDLADPIDSPSPINLTAQADDQGVKLSWTKSKGDTSSASTFMPTYVVQRCETNDSLASTERVWVDVAKDLSTTEYYDQTTESGKTYLYRVVANGARSNVDAHVTRARSGETLYWNATGTNSHVYALTNLGSNKTSWTRVFSSSTATSWTIQPTSASQFTGETFYRVVLSGARLDETSPSKAVRVVAKNVETLYVVEGSSILLRAGDEEDAPGATYWLDLSNSQETREENFVQVGKETPFDPSALGYQPGDRIITRTGLKDADGNWLDIQTRIVEVEQAYCGLTIDAQSFFDGQALTLRLESKTGRAIASWTIDWGDGSEPSTFETLGFQLVASHFYEPGAARDYAISLLYADCEGYDYETDAFPLIAPALKGDDENAFVDERASYSQIDQETARVTKDLDEEKDAFWSLLKNARRQ